MEQIIYVGGDRSFFKFLQRTLFPRGYKVKKFNFDPIRHRSFGFLASFCLIIIDVRQEWATWNEVLQYIQHLVSQKLPLLVVGGKEIGAEELRARLAQVRELGARAVVRGQSEGMRTTIKKILKEAR